MKTIAFIILLTISTTAYGAEMLTIKDLQSLVLKENPKIKSMELEAAMLKQRIPQSTALEDPKLKIGLNNIPTNNFSIKAENMTSKEISISQMFPLGGKLAVKESIAQKEYIKSLEKIKRAKLDILNMLNMNIYNLFYVRSSIKIVEEIKEQLQLVVQSEVAANKSSIGNLANVVKANVEHTMIDEELISLRQQEKEILHKISYLSGKDVDIKELTISEIDFKEISLDDVKEKIEINNPDINILKIDEEINGKEVILKQKEYYPDIELGISYMQRDSGAVGSRPDMVSAKAQINIPLWYKKKNIPMIAEMQKKQEMTKTLLTDKKNELFYKAETVIERLKQWENLYKLYIEQLIPQTEIVFETLLSRYRTSSVEFMPIIDTVRMLLKYKKEVLMIKKEYLSNVSELNTLMGVQTAP